MDAKNTFKTGHSQYCNNKYCTRRLKVDILEIQVWVDIWWRSKTCPKWTFQRNPSVYIKWTPKTRPKETQVCNIINAKNASETGHPKYSNNKYCTRRPKVDILKRPKFGHLVDTKITFETKHPKYPNNIYCTRRPKVDISKRPKWGHLVEVENTSKYGHSKEIQWRLYKMKGSKNIRTSANDVIQMLNFGEVKCKI